MIQQLVSAAAIAVNPKVENRVGGTQIFALTPASDITLTTIPDQLPGQEYCFIITTTGVTSRTLTFGAGFKITATLATGTTSGKVFVMKFISDGQTLNEISRTAAM